MRTPGTILLLLLTSLTFAQTSRIDYGRIDREVRSIDAREVGILSRKLTAPFNTDAEKVRAIFRWITENVNYKIRDRYRNRRAGNYVIYQEPESDSDSLLPVNDRVANRILHLREAICDGYARLFKALCDHAGIPAEIVIGYGRTNFGNDAEYFRSNHSWNAVWLDSAWNLLDVTWASGFVTYTTNEYMKSFDNRYYLTPPELFIRDHFPDDLRWTLLENPPTLSEFKRTPYKNRSFIKYDITSYFPSRGIIEASMGDTIRIELERARLPDRVRIAPDSLWDSTMLLRTASYAYLQPAGDLSGKKISYSYPVDSGSVEWLQVMYNNDVVLRYKLKIRKENDE